jgi:O-antigen/teichoic acid export membrane protein
VSFYQQLGKIIALNLLAKPLWLLAENWVQDKVGHASYGKFAALFNLSLLLAALVEGGLAQHLTRSFNPQATDGLAQKMLGLRLLLNALALFAALILGYGLGYAIEDLVLLLLLGLFHFLQSIISFLRALLQALQRFGKDAYASIGDKVLLLLGLPILVFAGLTVYSFALGLTLSAGCVLALLGWELRAYWFPPLLPSLKTIRSVLSQSLGLALMALLFSALERLNFILIERISGSVESSLYAGAYRWYSAVSMYLWTVLPPFYARFAKAPQDQALFNSAQIIVSLPIIGVCAFLFWYTPYVFFLFGESSPPQIERMALALRCLTLGLLANGLFNVYSTHLSACNREKYVNFLLLPAICLNALLTLGAARAYGALAGALGLTISLLFLSGGYVYFFAQKSGLKPPWGILLRLLTAAFFLFIGLGLGVYYDLHWGCNLLLNVLFWAALVASLGLLSHLRQLIAKR